MLKIGVISLGCDKNRVDTENIMTSLRNGYTFTGDIDSADIILVNTCAFIESARQESIDTILEACEYLKRNCKHVIVTGCMVNKYRSELQEQIPEVSLWLGTKEYNNIFDQINKLCNQTRVCANACYQPRVLTTPMHYAYLRIADGCNNYCAFCSIPSIRGRYTSVPMEEVINEAKSLCNNGAEELIIVAQDVTNYGADLKAGYGIVELIKELSKIETLQRMRLMYCYPERTSDALIDEIANNPKVMKYIDIPVQHISDKVLAKMKRRGDGNLVKNLINKLRSKIPNIAIRSTIMVGFPYETEEDVDELVDFIHEYKLDRVGFFKYSYEPDTLSGKMPQIPEEVKDARLARVAQAQQEVVDSINQSMIGRTIKVIYEDIDYDKQLFVGRPYSCAPSVDPVVYFSSDSVVDIGYEYDIKITAVSGYDLIGETTNEHS